MKRIGTHGGVFQADDVFAVACLKMHPEYRDAEVIRTRNVDVLENCDVVVDVGGEYDHSGKCYDHHQRGRAGSRDNGVLYSAFGLVWRHLGTDVVIALTGNNDAVLAVHAEVDRELVQGIDLIDNGQRTARHGARLNDMPTEEEIEADKANGLLHINVEVMSVSALIASMNPTWVEQAAGSASFDGRFEEAVRIASSVLRAAVASAYAEAVAEERVLGAIAASRFENPKVIRLANGGYPWQDLVIAKAPEALFVTFMSEEGTQMIQCVPDAIGSFGKRKALPEAWAGLRGGDLAALTGVKGAVFCHPGRFICGAETEEGAKALLRLALANED